MKEKYDLSFEEAQDIESKTRFDVYSNDGDIFINENDITRTIGNVLQFGIDYQKEMDDAHLAEVVKQWKAEEEMWIKQKEKDDKRIAELEDKLDQTSCYEEGFEEGYTAAKKETIEKAQKSTPSGYYNIERRFLQKDGYKQGFNDGFVEGLIAVRKELRKADADDLYDYKNAIITLETEQENIVKNLLKKLEE